MKPYDPELRQGSIDYREQLEHAWDLHLRKAAGYSGHSADVWVNFRSTEQFGVPAEIGCYIRMADKFERLKSLVTDGRNDQVNEPIEDLLSDIAAYALIAKCIRLERARDGS